MQKTPEQQIDDAVKVSKALFLPIARNSQEAENIERNIEAAGDHLKSLVAIVNDANLFNNRQRVSWSPRRCWLHTI